MPADSLMRGLELQAARYDFFLAVRAMECARRDLPRIGFSTSPSMDPVRFGQEPALAFPASTIEKFEQLQSMDVPRMAVRFFGLFGPNGPLPLHLTEYARERKLHVKDNTLCAFADMFHHRMISFFYRAWACNEPAVSYDRHGSAADIQGDEDAFVRYFASLIGLGTNHLMGRDSLPDNAKLYFSGRLLAGPRNPDGLAAILREFFGVRAEIEEFSGRWIPLPVESRCRLGGAPESAMLGRTLVVGSSVWDVQGKFRIVLGPMTLADFDRLLPGSPGFQNLCDWVKLFLNDELDWDVRLILRAGAVPPMILGQGCRLGYTTWLHTAELDHDLRDLVCRPVAA
jgi:type VI secretion system protein ImpH